MGWPTKGSGRSYNSLSGIAAYVGYFSKKILAHVVLNRKCIKCDRNHPKNDHDCKLNFEGSAKAMEPKAAAMLVDSNPIFKQCNVELGVFIGDNDSSAICAARNAANHEIVKQDDLNHTKKGLVSQLYKIIKKHKELNSSNIKYLSKCFNYCVSQNAGNKLMLAESLRNIPNHCFNNHENCGEWCRYDPKDPNSYEHSVIGKGFSDPSLYEALTEIFDSLANNSSGFSAGVSSNPNESLNSMYASKASKSRMYGMSNSYNIRVGLVALKKNDGDSSIVELNKNCNVSPGRKTMTYIKKLERKAALRYSKAITQTYKRRRLFLQQKKNDLRSKKESQEGPTYESDMTLLTSVFDDLQEKCIDDTVQSILVFFYLETGGLNGDCDILQIAVKYKNYEFSTYIKPN